MSPEFVFLMNVVLVSRLVYVIGEGRLSTAGLLLLMCLQVVGLLAFEPSLAWGILLVLLLVTAIVTHAAEKKSERKGRVRLYALAVQTTLISIACAPAVAITFNGAALHWLASLEKFTVMVAAVRIISSHGSDLTLLGALLVMNEVNLALRIQLKWLKLGPENAASGGTTSKAARSPEYMHGKVIGILERILIYVAVLSNQVAAIGLVLAAKGFVRFKEMDDRRFAEYVLIGTLLSALTAILVAMLVKALS
jgi:hypothetical protein